MLKDPIGDTKGPEEPEAPEKLGEPLVCTEKPVDCSKLGGYDPRDPCK